MTAPEKDQVCVGAIAGAHGVRGDVRIKPFTEHPMDVGAYGPLTTKDGIRSFEISAAKLQNDFVVARLSGISSREDALGLKGTLLYVQRATLPETEDEETWYHADLIGLAAHLPDGAELGKLVAVHDFGAGDLLEIALQGTSKLVMIPFTAETVPEVDIESGRLTIVPPEGLIG